MRINILQTVKLIFPLNSDLIFCDAEEVSKNSAKNECTWM